MSDVPYNYRVLKVDFYAPYYGTSQRPSALLYDDIGHRAREVY